MTVSKGSEAEINNRLEVSGVLRSGLVDAGHENLNPADMLRTAYYFEKKHQIEKSNAYRKLLVVRWPQSDEAFLAAEELGDELNRDWAEAVRMELEKIVDCREWYQIQHKALVRKVMRLEVIFIGMIVLFAMAMKALELLDGSVLGPLMLMTVLLINVPLTMLMYEKCPNCNKGINDSTGGWGFGNSSSWMLGLPDRCPHCKCRFK